ncbi:unnamed protein product, partial [marine sediment metagenome]
MVDFAGEAPAAASLPRGLEGRDRPGTADLANELHGEPSVLELFRLEA